MNEIQEIQERNKRVELDKAWEVSKTRRFIIAGTTYLVAATWLMFIGNDKPYLNALVPCGGYLLSTISLSYFKKVLTEKINH